MYYFLFDDHNTRNKAIMSENEYDREICDNCGGIRVSYKGNFKFKIQGKLCDYYSASGTFVISEDFLNVLKEHGYTGFEVADTKPYFGTVTRIGEPVTTKKYYRLIVTGRCGLMCDMKGDPAPICRKCRRKIGMSGFDTTGVSFVPEAYDGSDIFAFEDLSNIPIVSEEIKKVLKKSKLTNLRFVPLEEHEYHFDTIRKESALRALSKGRYYDELIEAWLKYGVVTKEELAEYGVNI